MGLVRDREHLVDWLHTLLLAFVWNHLDARVLHVVDIVNSREPFQLVLDHLLILGLLTKNSFEE